MNKLPYLTNLIMKLAPKVGARVIVEPEWGVAAQIIYRNGLVRSLRFYSLDLNHIASADIAKDKDYAKFFMKKKGYSVIPGETVFKDSWAKTVKSNRTISYGKKYAKKLGYPVIVKPNSQSQGSGVCVAWNEKDLREALLEIFKNDKIAVIEQYLPGLDYRIVVLDKKIISAYERIPLSVTGNGQQSILLLLKQKQKDFILNERDTKINFKDKRIKLKLKHAGYTLNTILPKNKKIYLLDNANLSTGGDAVDVTNVIHPGFKKIAINVTKDMGLRISGVDIMLTKGDITKNPKSCRYYIIEINAAPGLDHYVTTGRKQRKIVETMYLKVLKALGKKD
ncbi:MAG: cyanophycin synthetase [Candidatus Nomurabacteria bacterium GW2011_GWA1_37_20]|uniref:Cyanophycin synthetase n=2 Tax=Parcubacteria group TaxID=1794811 RepID=A0A0G0GQV4_9BACT|nr:MAG: cyanophycin synthetase [Parcubacteria group bacterium GW2011_GWC1_36_9]KKQ32412.1 MAG: cyanophycin synthetase [Candidatus Nomurabacteria bacterium GW2011_GWA1_37_20]